MKLTKTANGKIKLTQSNWENIGIKAGWLQKEALRPYSGPTSGSGTKDIELFKNNDGTASVSDEDGGTPFTATVTYYYSKAEPQTQTYPGSPEEIDIIDVSDATTNESVVVDFASVLDTYYAEFLEYYKDTGYAAYEDAAEGIREDRDMGL